MPRHLIARLSLLAALGAPMFASAAAESSLHVVGDGGIDVALSIDTNTANWNYQFLTVDVAAGQTVTRSWQYTVTVADDGLPALRTEDNVCTPDFLSDCGPPATGFEQAYALIEIGRDHRDVNDDNAFLEDGNLVQSFHSVTGDPHTFTGTLTWTGTNLSEVRPQTAQLQVMLFALADVSAVPEPAGAALALLALLPLAARRRRGPALTAR